MANVSLPLVGLENSVHMGIYYGITNDIKDFLRLHEDTAVTVVNSMGVEKTNMRNTTDYMIEAQRGSLSSTRRLVASVEEEYDEKTLGTGYTGELEAPAIYADEMIGTYIVPIYAYKNLTFTFEYISPSKDEIIQLRDYIRSIISNAGNVVNHSVKYTLILPDDVEHLIEMFHRLRSRLFPDKIVDYLQEHSSPALHTITDLTNPGNGQLGLLQGQEGIYGSFDMTTPPTAEHDNDRNIHSLTMTYKIHMEMPTRVSASFPAIICNKLIPNQILTKLADINLKRFEHYNGKTKPHLGFNASIFQDAFNDRSVSRKMSDVLYPINIPDYDDYTTRFDNLKGYKTVMTILCTIDEKDKRSLFNLRTDLRPWGINDKILKYIKEKGGRKVNQFYNSFLFIGLEQDGKYSNGEVLEIDDDFNVKSRVDLDLHRITRVTIKICTDPELLIYTGKQEFENDDEVFEIALNELLEIQTDVDYEYHNKRMRYVYLTGVIVKVLYRADERRDCRFIRSIVFALQKNLFLSTEVAMMLLRGYPELSERISECGIYITAGGIFIHQDDDDQVTKDKHNDRAEQDRDLLRPPSIIDKIKAMGWIDPYLPRTIMPTSVIVYRG